MLSGPLAALGRSRTYLLLLGASLLVGLRDAMAEPFLILFLVDEAHLAPLPLGILLTLRAAGAVAISMAFGAWLDRRASLAPLFVALALGTAGFLALTRTTAYPLLLLIVAGPLAANNAVFPQLFAIAKRHLDREGGTAAERGIALMRATFSAAWAVGPIVGAAAVVATGYTGNFLASAGCGAAALALIVVSGMRAPAGTSGRKSAEGPPGASFGIAVTAAGFTLFSASIVMGAVALPIVVTRDLGGTEGDVGAAAALCAALEIPVMVLVALRPRLFGGLAGLLAGFAALALYFVALGWTGTVPGVLAAQAARAVAIGLVGVIGISTMQQMMPGRAGAAAALYANTGQVGTLLGGLASGEWASLFGYRSSFPVCAAAALVGLMLVGIGARPVRLRRATPA